MKRMKSRLDYILTLLLTPLSASATLGLLLFSLAPAAHANDYFPAFSFQKGITPGISHLVHISSTFAWK